MSDLAQSTDGVDPDPLDLRIDLPSPRPRTTFGEWLWAAVCGWCTGVGLIFVGLTYLVAYPPPRPADPVSWSNALLMPMEILITFAPFGLTFSGVVTALLWWTGWPPRRLGWWAACLAPTLGIPLLLSVQ